MKKCKKCNSLKNSSEFSKSKSNLDGLNSLCKPCICKRNKEYYRTKEGLIRGMYSSLRANLKGRALPDLIFEKEDLIKWVNSQNIDELYICWATAGYPSDLKPSIDRIDSNETYIFSNMRLVTWGENSQAAYIERKLCKRVTRQCKEVTQLTLEGVKVERYGSIAKAARDNGFCRTNINACLKGKRETAHGFMWEYSINEGADKRITPRDKHKDS